MLTFSEKLPVKPHCHNDQARTMRVVDPSEILLFQEFFGPADVLHTRKAASAANFWCDCFLWTMDSLHIPRYSYSRHDSLLNLSLEAGVTIDLAFCVHAS